MHPRTDNGVHARTHMTSTDRKEELLHNYTGVSAFSFLLISTQMLQEGTAAFSYMPIAPSIHMTQYRTEARAFRDRKEVEDASCLASNGKLVVNVVSAKI